MAKKTKKTKAKAKSAPKKPTLADIAGPVAELQKAAGTLQEWASIIMNKPKVEVAKPEPAYCPHGELPIECPECPECPSPKPEAKKPFQHAADKVDINAVPLEELMTLAGRECSCVRYQRSQGIKDPVCSGECSHAKALEELNDRGIVV